MRRPQTHDCGPYGRLTRAQIAKIAGVPVSAIDARVLRGAQGADLCRPLRAPKASEVAQQPDWPAPEPLRGEFTWRIVGIPTEDSR
jgi:hypothetical protein